MNNLINSIRLVSQTAGQGLARTRIGTVTSYDPNTYSAKVLLQPEGVEIGWLPITSAWSGNGWGLFSPPTSGDTVHNASNSAIARSASASLSPSFSSAGSRASMARCFWGSTPTRCPNRRLPVRSKCWRPTV